MSRTRRPRPETIIDRLELVPSQLKERRPPALAKAVPGRNWNDDRLIITVHSS